MTIILTWELIFATVLMRVVVPAINMVFFDARTLLGGHPGEEDPDQTRQVSPLLVGFAPPHPPRSTQPTQTRCINVLVRLG